MTKRQRKILTIIILFASIGLVFAQIMWIFGVFTNTKSEMSGKVNELLNHVIDRVWQAETFTQVTDHAGFDSISLQESAIPHNVEFISRKETVLDDVDSIVQSADFVGDSSVVLNLLGKNRTARPSVNRYLVEYTTRLLTADTPVEQRVTIEQLDTLIVNNLKELDLDPNLKFKFAICDESGKIIMKSDKYSSTRSRVYKKRLFPNDPEGLSEIYFVTLYFPEETLIILGRIWTMIFSAFILIVVILTIFIYTLYIISMQKRMSEIKGDFISNITHELKTPISTISLAAQMLGDEKIPQAAKNIPKLSGMINEQSKQLSYLVEKVLQTSVFERQTITLSKTQVSLHAIIKEADDIMTLQLRNKKATLMTELRATNDIISTDKSYFVNVITNLLDNALKYSKDAPKIIVGTKNEYDKILCYVSDNGIGISSEDKDRIFEQFFRVNTGDIHDIKGFGLGLNYVKKIVDLTGGTVSVESEINVGTTFYIWLPLVNNSNNI